MHIRKRGKSKFQCVVRLSGNYLTKTFSDKKSCKQWGREQERLIERGSFREIPKNLTLRKLIIDYQKECLPMLKDQYNVSNQLKRLLNNYKWLMDKSYQNLKPIDFEQFKLQRVNDVGNQNSSTNNFRATNKDLRLLSIVINKAIKLWLIPITNHIDKVKFFPETNGLYRKIKGYEHRSLLKYANNQQKAVLLLLRHSGARPKELFQLKWIHIDNYNNQLIIPWDINKSNTGRRIHLRPYVIKLLYKYLDINNEKLIKISYTSFRFWFHRKVRQLKFNDFVMYHYRRNFVQYYADRNIPLPKLALMTGHKSYSLLARYYGHSILLGK